jgi:predicted CXXCH cytochrome family protein
MIILKRILGLLALICFSLLPIYSQGTDTKQGPGCISNGCHAKIEELIKQAPIEHPPANDGSCTVCHNPHGDEGVKDHSLKRPLAEICFGCHSEFGKRIRASRFIHAPLKMDRCGYCHASHGGNFNKLVKRLYFEPMFFPKRWVGYIRLCLECHEEKTILSEMSTTLTGFRNGNENLHKKHIDTKKGRSCEVCHATHASDQEFHIRPDVPFGTGGWKLPINHTKTLTGGSCIIGCHREMAYDRKKPIDYEPLSKPSRESGADKRQ